MINREDTKKIIKISSILIVVFIVLGYTLFASHNFILGPKITILEPKTGSTFATSSIIVKGIALRIRDRTIEYKLELVYIK